MNVMNVIYVDCIALLIRSRSIKKIGMYTFFKKRNEASSQLVEVSNSEVILLENVS